jgi:hypothetical protein
VFGEIRSRIGPVDGLEVGKGQVAGSELIRHPKRRQRVFDGMSAFNAD